MAHELLKAKEEEEMTNPSIHILAIDDDAQFLIFLKRSVMNENYLLSTARGYQEAKEFLEEGDVDLVLLDIGLGKENGLDYIELIRFRWVGPT